jgi:hypothetical protein
MQEARNAGVVRVLTAADNDTEWRQDNIQISANRMDAFDARQHTTLDIGAQLPVKLRVFFKISSDGL